MTNMLSELDEVAIKSSLESGDLLTAHQAAQAVGVTVSTFNYHRRQGRIPQLVTPGGVCYIYLSDAQAFKRKLDAWRAARTFSAFADFVVDEGDEGLESDERNERPTESPATCA